VLLVQLLLTVTPDQARCLKGLPKNNLWRTACARHFTAGCTSYQSTHSVKTLNGKMVGSVTVTQFLIFFLLPFCALILLVGQQEEHPACKKLSVGMLLVTI